MPISHDCVQKIYKYGTKISVKKGGCIFNPRSKEEHYSVYLLDSGICALTSITKNGDEKIYLYFAERRIVNFVPMMSGFSKSIRTETNPFTIVAKTDCVLYKLSESVFQQLLHNNPEFVQCIMQVMAENYINVVDHFLQSQEESAVVRLCRFLLEYSEIKKEKQFLPSYFTYEELAKYLDIHKVTVARIFAKLKHYGYISRQGHTIILEHPDRIQNLIDADINLDY